MSGGVTEYVAACMEGIPGNDSGFDTETLASEMEKGYIDKYDKNSKISTYNKRILGDATGEMGPFYSYFEGDGSDYIHSSWYGDYAVFVASTYPWFSRGGYWVSGGIGGQFYFSSSMGDGSSGESFRIVLSPT